MLNIINPRGLDLEALLTSLSSPASLVELLLGVGLIGVAWGMARLVYHRWYAAHPERMAQFLPYMLQRLALPVLAVVMLLAAQGVSIATRGVANQWFVLLAAGMAWGVVTRIVAAGLRSVLPAVKLEQHSEHVLATLLWLGYLSWAVGMDDFLVDWLQSLSFMVGKTRLTAWVLLNGILWLIIILFASMWASRAIERRVMGVSHLDMNFRIVLSNLARTLLVVMGVLVALPVVGIDLSVLSVFGGALGVGLGFGLQKVASNYVSGFIILLERSVRIGDRVTIDNRTGYITQITARYTVLKGMDGTEMLVPNEALIANTVVNQSYSDPSLWFALPVQVAYGTDLDHALAVLVEAAKSVPRVMTDPEPSAFVVAFADSGINLEVGIWCADPDKGLLGLKSDVNLAIWRRFNQAGIHIPFPQREVRVQPPVAAAAVAPAVAGAANP